MMDSIAARRLLGILRPYDPHMIGREMGPEFLCATPETLRKHGFSIESFSRLPETIYDGKDFETNIDGDQILEKQEVHVFLRNGLQQLAGPELNGWRR